MLRAAVVAAACVPLGGGLAAASSAQTAPAPGGHAARSAAYLRLAEKGIVQADHWRAQSDDWFYETSPPSTPTPLVTIWGVVQLMQSVDAVDLADPTAAHAARVDWFARKAEGFWNVALGGYAPYLGWKSPHAEIWFDDNGWIGLSFLSAYQATHEQRYLADAQRAFHFIFASGWDSSSGGLWWNTDRSQRSGEALAAAALLGALLNRFDGDARELHDAQLMADWMQSNDLLAGTGLYGSMSSGGDSAVDYIQAPMVYAQYLICRATGQADYCQRAARVAAAALRSYGARFNFAPQYDAIYLQWMMAYGQATGDPHFLAIAEQNAAAANQHAAVNGLWLGSWWGGPIGDTQTGPGMLRTVGATTSLFAWLAYYTGGSGTVRAPG